MGRPPLDIGTYGKIYVPTTPDTNGRYMARCKFRDFDGHTRTVARWGDTKAAAERALKRALSDRQAPGGTGITPDTKLAALADQWLADIQTSDRAQGTKDTYEYMVNHTVKPAFGGIRVREVKVAALDRAIREIRERQGPGAAKTTKSVLSGMFKLAIRHEALEINPVRDTTQIPRAKKAIRALTKDETDQLLDALRSMERAVLLDLPDLVDWMLYTGCRIGEACAAREERNPEGKLVLDLAAGTWEVNATVIRVRGAGLMIQERPKTEAGWRVLALPPGAVEMMERRKTESRHPVPRHVAFGAAQAKALRDPRNTNGDLREVLDAIGCDTCGGTTRVKIEGTKRTRSCPDIGLFSWVTSHVFRKTVATRLDEAGLSARQIADQLGHARPSLTQDVYMGRNVVTAEAATILDR